jgi:hypothetical protein
MAELARIEVNDYGGSPIATHNYPCPVCVSVHAVYQLNWGRFQPCWGCQSKGWRVVRVPKWLRRWLE